MTAIMAVGFSAGLLTADDCNYHHKGFARDRADNEMVEVFRLLTLDTINKVRTELLSAAKWVKDAKWATEQA